MISRPSAQRSRRGALYSGLDGSGGPRRAPEAGWSLVVADTDLLCISPTFLEQICYLMTFCVLEND